MNSGYEQTFGYIVCTYTVCTLIAVINIFLNKKIQQV